MRGWRAEDQQHQLQRNEEAASVLLKWAKGGCGVGEAAAKLSGVRTFWRCVGEGVYRWWGRDGPAMGGDLGVADEALALSSSGAAQLRRRRTG